MKVGALPQNLIEALAMLVGAVPRPAFDSLLAVGLARTLLVATKLGIFEALAEAPRAAGDLARVCQTDPVATRSLLVALGESGYLEERAGLWRLSAMARKWTLAQSPRSLRDQLLLMELVWTWMEHYETFVKTGEPLDVHSTLSTEQWGLYQRGMRSFASLSVDEFILRTPIPRDAARMIDVGGSHGLYAAALCRKHPRLRAEILDLPDATAQAKDMVEAEALGDRLVQREGDARTHDFGESRYDVVLLSNIVHHFDADTNADLVRRIARALRPAGVLVVQEPFVGLAKRGDQVGALASFYFASLSASGWSVDQTRAWAQAAGLRCRRPTRFLTAPGLGQLAAVKP